MNLTAPARVFRYVAIFFLGWTAQHAFGEKPPFKILYNSDTTHILTCTSVWRPNREKLSRGMFVAAVDEAANAGADAFLMAPGLGWVPWWQSKVVPLDNHAAWFRDHFHLPNAKSAFLDFIMQGNDIIAITGDRCHEKGMAFFISFRLNDVHGKDTLANPTAGHIASVPRFYVDHPEFLLGPQPSNEQTGWARYLQNWVHPEVRDSKLNLIGEVCRNNDIDGLELDFMRAPYFFRQSETSAGQRREIMLGFVKQVRQLLDLTMRAGKHRWLSVRIPSRLEAYDAMGIDLPAWSSAGVDMFNLASSYHIEQTNDLAEVRELVPASTVYLELTHVVAFNGNARARSHRRATKELLDTSAHLAYAGGADGISLFNFQYFRDYRDAKQENADGPYSEPPFALVKELGNPSVVATQPQHYYQGMIMAQPPRPHRPFPVVAKPNEKLIFPVDLAPPNGGWKTAGRLRFQSDQSFGDRKFLVEINGTPLVPNPDVSEPYPTIYTQMQGKPDELRAWSVPPEILRAGHNEIALSSLHGSPARLIALDLALPGSSDRK